MRGGGSRGVSANEYSCTQGAEINFGDPTPYLPYCREPRIQPQALYTMDKGLPYRMILIRSSKETSSVYEPYWPGKCLFQDCTLYLVFCSECI